MDKLKLITNILLIIICSVEISTGQIITTVSGNGTSTFINTNSVAINNGIGYPMRVAFDKYGNSYFTSYNLHRVFKVDISGNISCIAGTGIAGYSGDSGLAINAKINTPYFVAIDSSDDIFIADTYNHRIRKIDHYTGIITTIAGSGAVGNANGSYSGDSSIATSATLNDPMGICFDKKNNLFIADANNERIRKVDAVTGIITTIAGTSIYGFSGASGLAINAQLNSPFGICIDNIGNLFIADAQNNRARKIDTFGIITTVAGNGSTVYNGDGILAINAGFLELNDVSTNSSGALYIADRAHNRVRMVDSIGIIHTIAGTGVAGFSGDSGAATNAQIYYCEGISFDNCSNLYISDFQNKRIRKVWFNTDTLPQVNIAVTPNDTVITGTAVTTTATATNHGTIIGYQWVKNGVNASTNSTYTYTPTNGDNVYCIVTVRACTGRMYTDTTITIHITVNSGVGVANTTNYSTHTYPNPVIDVLQVETTTIQHYTLFNTIGKAVMNGSVDKNNSIDMRAIPTGIYLLQVTDADGQREVIRVVKE